MFQELRGPSEALVTCTVRSEGEPGATIIKILPRTQQETTEEF